MRITRYTCHDSLQSLNLTGKTLSLIHIKTLNFDPHFVIRTILHNSERFLKLLNVNATTIGKTYEFLPTWLPVTRVKFTNKQSFASSLKNDFFRIWVHEFDCPTDHRLLIYSDHTPERQITSNKSVQTFTKNPWTKMFWMLCSICQKLIRKILK